MFVELLIALIAGIALGAATFTPWLWPIAPFSICIILLLLQNQSLPHALARGYFFGIGITGAAFSWGFDALPLNWLGIPDPIISVYIMVFVWGMFSLVVATPVALWACLVRSLHSASQLLFLAPILWVMSEFLRAAVHALLAWGSGSTLHADLSFGFGGYALAWSDYLWIAQSGGVVALSLVVAFLGTLLYVLLRRGVFNYWGKCGVSVGVVFVLFGFVLPDAVRVDFEPAPITINGITIATLSTRFPPDLKSAEGQLVSRELSLAGNILRVTERAPDILVLPEYSRYLKNEHLLPETRAQEVRTALQHAPTLLIDSERSDSDQRGAILLFDGSSVLEKQYKRLLIPFGEYFPNFLLVVFRWFGFDEAVGGILAYRTYVPSSESFANRVFTWKGVTIGVLACSESFAPFGYKMAADNGADVLINIASHSWVRGSTQVLFKETLSMARVHARYTGKPYIQATNFGASYVVWPN